MQITRNGIETAPGPSEWFTGAVYIDAVAAPVGRVAAEREQRPLHAGRAHGLAHAPERPDDLGHRGRRPLPAARRPDRGDPPRRPRLLRAGRRALARRRAEPVHDPPRDARGRRRRPPRDVGRPRHRRGVRGGAAGGRLSHARDRHVRRRRRPRRERPRRRARRADRRPRHRHPRCDLRQRPLAVQVDGAERDRAAGWATSSSASSRRSAPTCAPSRRATSSSRRSLWSDGTCVFCREGLQTSCLHGGWYGDPTASTAARARPSASRRRTERSSCCRSTRTTR